MVRLIHSGDIHLDCPFSGLDPVNAILLKDVVKEQIAKGKIVLFSSHQMSYIEEFCDSIAILNSGFVALQGDLYDIKRDYPRDRLVVRSVNYDSIIKDFGSSCKKDENGSLIITFKKFLSNNNGFNYGEKINILQSPMKQWIWQ